MVILVTTRETRARPPQPVRAVGVSVVCQSPAARGAGRIGVSDASSAPLSGQQLKGPDETSFFKEVGQLVFPGTPWAPFRSRPLG